MTRKRQNRQYLTNGERWKRYREGNMKKYRKDDTLNKKTQMGDVGSQKPYRKCRTIKAASI